MLSKIKNLFEKIHNKGIVWLFYRFCSFIRGGNLFNLKFFSKLKSKQKHFFAVYDLNNNSPSFNIVAFILLAEQFCIEKNFDNYTLVIVPKKIHKSLEWSDLVNAYGKSSLEFRNLNLYPQLASLSSKCSGYIALNSRKETRKLIGNNPTYPENYGLYYGGDYDFTLEKSFKLHGVKYQLTSPDHCKKIVQSWKNLSTVNKDIVTITIRNSKFDKARNSNVEDYIKFAKRLEEMKFFPVIIPDTDNPFIESNFDILKSDIGFAAAFNTGIRLALYEISFVNFFSPNGPQTFTMYSKNIPYIFFVSKLFKSVTAPKNLKTPYYMDPDTRQVAWADKKQWIVHEDESFENMVKVFEKYCSLHKN